jgi:hypothetical protein
MEATVLCRGAPEVGLVLVKPLVLTVESDGVD